mgnify:CR=1 FL=1|tara:strand:+ start:7338 stop:8651 length:1314 start_codon:yes stop_codon:yes gene_type:complete
MSGLLKVYKDRCSVTLSTTATALANVLGTVHYMTNSNAQIRVGQSIGIGNVKVISVVSEVYNGARRSKVTLSNSTAINANTVLTFTSNDNTFSTSGRVGEVSNFKITIERIVGSILSPKPTLNFSDVYSMSSYKVTSVDTFENTTELIKREYNITYKVPLKKSVGVDNINVKATTITDETGVNNQIFGYEFLTKPPGQNLEDITVKKASFLKDLTSISFPSKRNINKKAETRLLIVYGDPGVTFKLGVLSNVIPITSNASAQTNQTTLSMGNGTAATVAKINKGMTITYTASSGVSEGIKVVSTSGTSVVVSTAQSLAANEQISFGHVLVAANTVKTIDENGIYAEYINFPKNNSTTNITFTITLTENSTNKFVGFNSPETVNIVSLTAIQSAPTYLASTEARVTKSNQTPATSSVSTGGGSTVTGLASVNNENLGF